MSATQRVDPAERRVPPMGGFNPTLLRIELRRMMRNRRTIIFALVFPAAMFLVFGSGSQRRREGRRRQRLGVRHGLDGMYGGALIAASATTMADSPRSTRRPARNCGSFKRTAA